MDGDDEGRPTHGHASTQMPSRTWSDERQRSRNGTATRRPGLPPEQLYTWLEWVQDDLRRVETRLEFLEGGAFAAAGAGAPARRAVALVAARSPPHPQS